MDPISANVGEKVGVILKTRITLKAQKIVENINLK